MNAMNIKDILYLLFTQTNKQLLDFFLGIKPNLILGGVMKAMETESWPLLSTAMIISICMILIFPNIIIIFQVLTFVLILRKISFYAMHRSLLWISQSDDGYAADKASLMVTLGPSIAE